MAHVKNHRKGIWSTDKYVVLPGEVGVIPDEDWAKLKKVPSVEALLKDGDLEEVSETGEPKKKGPKDK